MESVRRVPVQPRFCFSYAPAPNLLRLVPVHLIGQPGMALSISPISRIVSFKATTTF